MRGVTIACLKLTGNLLSLSDRFIIDVIGVIKTSRYDLTKDVGQGSRLHCLSGDLFIVIKASAA